ncbi:hypothetical protein GRX01_02455 [Halobaculum sp. WSA2]|uniref:Domain of unknown function domain-containing protein n=1 Tax=Halobaculum saliterrae TaxID=2073113 RepID=A0A6B0SU53_9EURY|nr:hypothetical protein [Halobaculum saliterrae]MXR40221.1 hypothetical protein [Halobaculum saliterrae]
MPDDRDRGILTPADRRYLRGETEFASVQSERNARARIRDRIHAALYDFEVLVGGMSERDRELVFADRLDREGTAAFDALVSALAFLYRGVEDTELDFETVLSEGVNLAEASEERAATVDLDVTFHALSVAEVRRKMRAGEPLSLTELAFADTRTEVSADEFAEYLRGTEGTVDDAGVDDGRIQSRVTDF